MNIIKERNNDIGSLEHKEIIKKIKWILKNQYIIDDNRFIKIQITSEQNIFNLLCDFNSIELIEYYIYLYEDEIKKMDKKLMVIVS